MAKESLIALLNEHLWPIFVYGMAVILTTAIAKAKKYYLLPPESEKIPIKLKHVFLAFLIYFGSLFFLSPIFSFIIKVFIIETGSSQIALASWVNILTLSFTALLFFTIFFILDKSLFTKICKTNRFSSVSSDALAGIFAWLFSFPAVLFISSLLELLVLLIFKTIEIPDQIAVRFLKMAIQEPFFLILALITIVVIAPFIEEFLFRGILQNFFKTFVNRKTAILFSSLLFTLFHFSISQGVGNITILGPLFILSCFLGFIYEKRNSLISPIALHAIFNLISAINLIYLKGS